MIALVSCLLAAYEATAVATKRPKVSDLSHTWPYGIFIWFWLCWLAIHFMREARKSHF